VDGVDYDALEVLVIENIQEDCDGDFVASEVTLNWYAQDDFGNIWYMGELSRSFDEEDGCDGGDFDRTTPANPARVLNTNGTAPMARDWY